MKILIFASNKDIGINKFKELINKYTICDRKRIYFNCDAEVYSIFVELLDGTTYKICPCSDFSGGYKGDKAYVSIDTPTDIINYIIRPCLSSSILPTSEQIIFY
jgi:hypothetical protein